MNNVNDIFFDGYYKDIWRSLIPEELTAKEIDFILHYFNLESDKKVMDIMCGYGRHALALGRKGIHVVAIDNLHLYTQEINEIATSEKIPVKVVCDNIVSFDIEEEFDLTICMGNSICFFNRIDVIKVMKMVSSHLKPGGYFLINSWTIAEIAFQNFQARGWAKSGEFKFLADSKYFFKPTRIETEQLILSSDGKSETKHAIDYIYSIAETEDMLNEAGFSMEEVYSIPGRKRFTLGDSRAYIVAKKLATF